MAGAVELSSDYDRTDVPHIVRCSIQLGILESVFVLLCSLITRFLEGPAETIPLAIVLVIGLALVSGLPGLWTRARTIEGIAGAAGIGLGATVVFLLIDVALLQPIGTYTNRWREIGGFSNWWYHPVWWMVGTYLPWMGMWILANQAIRGGGASSVIGVRHARVRPRSAGSPRSCSTSPGPVGTSPLRHRLPAGAWRRPRPRLRLRARRAGDRCAGFGCSSGFSAGCSRRCWRGQLRFLGRWAGPSSRCDCDIPLAEWRHRRLGGLAGFLTVLAWLGSSPLTAGSRGARRDRGRHA